MLGGVAAQFEGPVRDLLGDGRATASYFYLGMVLGWLWYRLYPRTLAERLAALALLMSILFLIPLGGGSVEGGLVSPSDVIGFGAVAGLVLTERWKAEARTAFTSRQTMRELR